MNKVIVNIYYNGKIIVICDRDYLDFVLYGLTLKLDEEKLFCEIEELNDEEEVYE